MYGRKTGGRKAGTPNKLTAEIRDLVRADGPAIFKELVRLAFKSKSEQTRLGAMKEILDRAYGKAPQPLMRFLSGALRGGKHAWNQEYQAGLLGHAFKALGLRGSFLRILAIVLLAYMVGILPHEE